MLKLHSKRCIGSPLPHDADLSSPAVLYSQGGGLVTVTLPKVARVLEFRCDWLRIDSLRASAGLNFAEDIDVAGWALGTSPLDSSFAAA